MIKPKSTQNLWAYFLESITFKIAAGTRSQNVPVTFEISATRKDAASVNTLEVIKLYKMFARVHFEVENALHGGEGSKNFNDDINEKVVVDSESCIDLIKVNAAMDMFQQRRK